MTYVIGKQWKPYMNIMNVCSMECLAFQTASFANNHHVALPSLCLAVEVAGGRHGLAQTLECNETSQGWLQHWTPNTRSGHLRCEALDDPLSRLSPNATCADCICQNQNRCTGQN